MPDIVIPLIHHKQADPDLIWISAPLVPSSRVPGLDLSRSGEIQFPLSLPPSPPNLFGCQPDKWIRPPPMLCSLHFKYTDGFATHPSANARWSTMLSSKSGSKSHSNQQQDDGFLITDFRSLKLQVFLLHHCFFVLIASRGKVISNKTAIKELEIKWINIFSLTDIILELIPLLTDNYQENIWQIISQ